MVMANVSNEGYKTFGYVLGGGGFDELEQQSTHLRRACEQKFGKKKGGNICRVLHSTLFVILGEDIFFFRMNAMHRHSDTLQL